MAEVINMPRLSDTMEEGTVAKWLFDVGEKVSEGDILAEIETDKATMEFESFNEGTLLHIGVQEGETAPVDVLLAIIGDPEEDISGLINADSLTITKVDESQESIPPSEPISTESMDSSQIVIPNGVEVITMPRLSDTMEEGTVATWNKKEGDTVEEGDILAEIETDKATMEFESFYSGVLLEIGVKEGETALVDSVLAIIGPKGTDVSGLLENYSSKDKRISIQAEKQIDIPVVEEVKIETSKTTIALSDTTSNQRIFISPLAKKLAEEKGINLSQLKGSGEQGRIIKRDIENYQPVSSVSASYIPVGQESFEEVKKFSNAKGYCQTSWRVKIYGSSLLFDYRVKYGQCNFS
jgi:pyruvate dehydrogenase E2 component (dihydrolipoamide acetyltransferase)